MFARSLNQNRWLVSIALILVSTSCNENQNRNRIDERQFPRIILWAWERPENLEFLDSKRFGVAYLAQTLTLKNDDVVYAPRRQLLKVPSDAKLIAVTRIESEKTTHELVTLSAKQREQVVHRILDTQKAPNVVAIQIDFDAVTSERTFYRQLLADLRQQLPDQVPLSMTALASFCIGDRWLNDLPVDEAVPMVFRMGTDSNQIKRFLAAGNDFREGLCRRGYGLALDEPVKTSFEQQRRVYIFNSRPWTPTDVNALNERFRQ